MKIEVGESYRTRDGKKATILETIDDSIYKFNGTLFCSHTSLKSLNWTSEGGFIYGEPENGWDLVEEWTDYPAGKCDETVDVMSQGILELKEIGEKDVRINVAPEFEVHMLNEEGKIKAKQIAESFSILLTNLINLCGSDGREMAIVRIKLEEACFFAKKTMANKKENQQ
jgi:hypothetical protein